MLTRYTLAPMRQLWSRPETKFEFWLKVELAFLAAKSKRKEIAETAYEAIRDNAKINVERIERIDKEIEHDMIAFGDDVRESLVEAGVGQHKEEFHKGITSYDVEDPALILMLREAFQLILSELMKLREALDEKAMEHKWTFMIHRTHGQAAEPGSFGHLLLVHSCEIDRSIRRVNQALEFELSEGKMSGAVGIYGGIDPELEVIALRELGLRPAMAETQILQRDRHAAALSVLAIAASSIERIARTFWEMMRSDVGELREPRKAKQKGSSAMPHKRNPILTERLIGAARLLRSHLSAALENIATPECRDISQSIVERHILPDATSLLHYMANKATGLVGGLEVNQDRMLQNLEATTYGTWASQQIRNRMMDLGVDYHTAYEYVQQAAFEASDTRTHIQIIVSTKSLSKDDVRTGLEILGPTALEACFDVRPYVEKGIEEVFRRAV